MTSKIGFVSWDEIDSGNQSAKDKELQYDLVDGKNRVRIITKPAQYYVHQWKAPNDISFGTKIKCALYGKDSKCPLCDQGLTPKKRWVVGIIERKNQSYKLLDIGWGVMKDLMEAIRNEEYGDLIRYDVTITKNSKAIPADMYKTLPSPSSPLSASDLELKQKVDLSEIERKVQHPSYEEVVKQMERRKAWLDAKAKKQAEPAFSFENE